MRRTLKPLLALTAGLALLFLGAAPSGATTGTVNSGTLSVNLTPALSVNLAPGTGPCPGASALSLDVTTSGTSSPYGADTTATINDGAFTYSGATYFLDGITANAPSGTVTPGGTLSTGNFTSTVGNIYPETSPGSCVPNTSAPLCAGVRLDPAAPLSLSGSFSGTVTPPGLSGTAVVSGSGNVQAVGCSSPFGALDDRILTLTSVNVTF